MSHHKYAVKNCFLPGFDAAKASEVTAGSLENGKVTFAEGSDTIAYCYECSGDWTRGFSLKKSS